MTGINKGRPLEKPPTVSKELMDWLEVSFPIINPNMDDTDRQIFYRVGQRSVVEHLLALFKEQNDNLLE